MPVYNAALFLEESLQSIAAQTYSQWQLVLVDDGSTDASVEIYQQFAANWTDQCLYVPSPHQQSGAAVCRNIGLQNCTGAFVVFLDADDLLAPFCLTQRVAAIGDNDMTVFQQYSLDSNLHSTNKIFNGKASNRKDAVQAFMKMEAPWQTMAPIWRKTALQILNGFDASLVYMEDPDLHLRALLNQNITISFAYHLPADNYYRVNNMNAAKLALFYDNSIKSRIVFLHKLSNLSTEILDQYTKDIRDGFAIFIKNFVLARFNIHKNAIYQITQTLQQVKILRSFDVLKWTIIFNIFASNNIVVKVLRLKGLVYKII